MQAFRNLLMLIQVLCSASRKPTLQKPYTGAIEARRVLGQQPQASIVQEHMYTTCTAGTLRSTAQHGTTPLHNFDAKLVDPWCAYYNSAPAEALGLVLLAAACIVQPPSYMVSACCKCLIGTGPHQQ